VKAVYEKKYGGVETLIAVKGRRVKNRRVALCDKSTA